MRIRKTWLAMLASAALLGGFFAASPDSVHPDAAFAANSSDFSAGYIISDEKFYDGGAMSAAQVQAFLNEKVPRCTIGDPGRLPGMTWGSTQIAAKCLRDLQLTTASRAANAYCAAYPGSTNESAAQIIAKVGAACGISQQALLVLLEKEQSLISDSWPTVLQIDRAMGYACPDSGPNNSANCDPSQSGFFQQVYRSAWQFKVYLALPSSYNHIAGRINHVRYSPDPACGASPVFIQNAATAGLYNYTPYQPNQAALNNMYGSGDSCSTYGNRNFWRMYSDWFGSPTGPSSLVRTAGNATTYLVSGSLKYPISNPAVLEALSPLGPVNQVSDAYLGRFATAHTATQVLRGPDGSIFFTGSGIKLPFTSCDVVAHYGGSCASSGYVQLDAVQIAKFATGPVLSRLMGTVEGSRYYLENGVKREILDDQSQSAAGVSGAMNVLTEKALSSIPFGVPIVRDSAIVARFDSADRGLLDATNKFWTIRAADAKSWGLDSVMAGRLRAESIAKLPGAQGALSGLFVDESGQVFLLDNKSKLQWKLPASASGIRVPVSSAFLSGFATAGEVGPGSFVKTAGSGTIYLITDPTIRPIGSWETLVSMSEQGAPSYLVVPDVVVAAYPSGPIALEAGTLVRSESNATVYVVNGITNKLPISSFDPVFEAGLKSFSFTLQERIEAYPTSAQVLEYGLQCDTKKYLAAGGSIHEVSAQLAAEFPFPYLEMDRFVCRQMTVAQPMTNLIRTPDGSIYQIEAQKKRHVTSMARYLELSAAGQSYVNVSARFGEMVPAGEPLL